MVEFSEEKLGNHLNQEVIEHIEQCEKCQLEMSRFQFSLELINDAKNLERPPETPPDFAEQVMDKVRRGVKPRWPFRELAFHFTFVLCIVVLVAVSLFRTGFVDRQDSLNMAARESVEVTLPDFQTGVADESDMVPLHKVREHIAGELVRLLEETMEVVERGDQEWEIEI